MKQLYLDMDGVLADFDKKRDEHFPHFKGLTQDQVSKEANDAFWKAVDEEYKTWFYDLEPMADFPVLWEYCRGYNPIVLTALPRLVYRTAVQKQKWLQKYVGPHVPVIMCKRKHKADYAHNGILVDDSVENVVAFLKAGGEAVLHENAEKTIQKLKNIL